MTRRFVLDVETMVEFLGGRAVDGRSQNPHNSMVALGLQDIDTKEIWYVPVNHLDKPADPDGFNEVKRLVEEEASLLVMHNAQFDLQWIWAVGIDYHGDIHDTMVGEYLLARGRRMPMSLAASCERRNLSEQKSDATKEYFNKGVGYEAMPWQVVEEYGKQDLRATTDLYLAQLADYMGEPLHRTLLLTCKFTMCLAEMCYAGMRIDAGTLLRVEREFREEKAVLEQDLREIVSHVMGDMPYNLASPEQLSQILYSRRPKSKQEHARFFQLDRPFRPKMSESKYKQYLRQKCEPVYRTFAVHCTACDGTGKVFKTRKDGTKYARGHTCAECGGVGTRYQATPTLAGFKINPPNSQWATAGGFSTDKNRLQSLARQLESVMQARPNMKFEEALSFIKKVERLGALDTYLSSFVEGIHKRMLDGYLYAEFNQCRTATGRLSSSSPNLQNMPRAGTFPVKKAFVSRFPEGQLIEFDFAQLEFRVAAHLAQDETAKHEILTGFDVHQYTADYLTTNGQPTTRQEAKSRTFAPLYGSVSGTPAERAYNMHFVDKYEGIRRWHGALQDEAIRTKLIKLPTGREFAFPDAKRTPSGGASGSTKIKNYPCQSVATACFGPACLIHLRDALRADNRRALIINTVHDSVLLDVPPDEVIEITLLLDELLSPENIERLIKTTFDIDLYVPLLIEQKVGNNWLDMH